MYIFFHTDVPKFSLLKERVSVPFYWDIPLLCQAEGSPAPVIRWYKDGGLIQNSTSVMYTAPWNAKGGNYICVATNDFGKSKQRVLEVVKQSKQSHP